MTFPPMLPVVRRLLPPSLAWLVIALASNFTAAPVRAQLHRGGVDSSPIVMPVVTGDVNSVKALLDKDPSLAKYITTNGPSILYDAISSRRMDDEVKRKAVVTLLLEKGADPNFSGKNLTFTPLITAINNGNKEIAALLLDKGADPNQADLQGTTPLQHAAEAGGTEMMSLLINKGVNLKTWDQRGLTPLQVAVSSPNSSKDLIELMLTKGADPNERTRSGRSRFGNDYTSRGLTALHYAAQGGNPEIVTLLLAHKADINARSDAGDTPLHLAASARSAAINTLLGAGANPNSRNESGDTPLQLALRPPAARSAAQHPTATGNPPDPLGVLIAKSDLTLRDQYGLPPFLLALLSHDLAARTLLVARKMGLDPFSQAFDAAAMNDAPRLSRVLTEKPFLADARLSNGWTPLHLAALWSAKDTAAVLLKKGVDVNVRDSAGATPLLRALDSGGVTPAARSLVSLLVQIGADVNAFASTETPPYINNGWRMHMTDTPLDQAITAGDKDLVTLFIAKGANLSDRTAHKDTPLLVAIKTGHADLAPALVAAGADVNAQDEVDMSALVWAVKNSQSDLARLLIDKGADVNAGDTNDMNPLMWAASNGDDAMVKLLIEKKANPAARNMQGRSAIGFARSHRNTAMADLLKQLGVPE